MSTEQPGRTSRSNTPGSPVGSTIAIVVTIVAVVLGFFILKQIRDDSDGTTRPASSTSTTSSEPVTTDPPATSSSTPELIKTGTKVQVANASTQDGVARQLTLALTGEGFDLADATNAVIKLDASKVLYDESVPAAKDVAESVAIVMGGIAVEVAPIPPPTKDAVLPEGTGVLVLLGNDRAGKTLAQMNGEVTTGDTAPVTPTS